ncbi:MAG: Wzz/FepE/Etk N-terminal domain-containing protein [Gudongella sp.]|jgi:capsular polysaccharide biosynthesis protein|nr:Wzz/FepE/Etk N-terminal domain-containing protein [Gudongella sp.]
MEREEQFDEISLRELIETLIKQKKLIAAITAAAVILTMIYSFVILKPTYEANMLLMTSDTAISGVNGGTSSIDKMLDSITDSPSMNVETYRQQIISPEVMRKTIDTLNLGDQYSIRTLRNKISIETIKDTKLISIKMTSTDSQMASDIINKIGDNFIEFVNENAKRRANASTEYIVSQMEIEKKLYEETLLQQRDLLSEPRGSQEIALEMEAIMNQLTELKTGKNEWNLRLQSLEAAVKVAEANPAGGSSLTLNQETGKVLLDSSEKSMKIEMAELQAKISGTEKLIPELESHLEDLRVEYEEKQYKEGIINQKVDLARSTYEAFVKKHEEIRVAESALIGEASVSVVSRAYPAHTPVGPNKTLNVAIGLVLGLMLGVFAAFFTEYWKQSAKS